MFLRLAVKAVPAIMCYLVSKMLEMLLKREDNFSKAFLIQSSPKPGHFCKVQESSEEHWENIKYKYMCVWIYKL